MGATPVPNVALVRNVAPVPNLSTRPAHPAGQGHRWLLDMVEGLARTAVAPEPDHPSTATPLLWTERYEVWRLVWAPGEGSPWHFHAQGLGALFVVEGALEERTRGSAVPRVGIAGSPVGRSGRSRWIRAGEGRVFSPGRPHRLRAAHAGATTAVYAQAPPLLGPRPEGSECLLPCAPSPGAARPAIG
jgi:mannose-6-phosphate isomerase-like protein (cupin superfamily)